MNDLEKLKQQVKKMIKTLICSRLDPLITNKRMLLYSKDLETNLKIQPFKIPALTIWIMIISAEIIKTMHYVLSLSSRLNLKKQDLHLSKNQLMGLIIQAVLIILRVVMALVQEKTQNKTLE